MWAGVSRRLRMRTQSPIRPISFTLLAVAALLVPVGAAAQVVKQEATAPDASCAEKTNGNKASTDAPCTPPTAPEKPPAGKSRLSRWIEFQTGTLAARYRFVQTSQGVVSASHAQHSGQARMRFNVDPKARLSVTVLFSPGSGFTSSWNNLGPGTGEFTRSWALEHLYAAAVPVTGVEMSFGSIGFVRGESTEITSYDNDGYMAGERISVKRPKSLYFDELAVTSAFLGYTSTPAFWDRADSLTESRNYFQYFASKKLTKTVGASADYTRVAGVPTFRTGIAVKMPKAMVVDAVRYEQYFRGGSTSASGFAVFGEKSITKKVNVGIGLANIDANYGPLNADRFGKGKRLYETASVKVTPEFTVQLFMAQAFGNDYPVGNRYRFDLVANYNVLGRIQRAGYLK